MELQVVPRRSATRCAWCRGEGDLVTCDGCATLLHAACWRAATTCPTLGCDARRPRPTTPAEVPTEQAEVAHALLLGGIVFVWGAAQLRVPASAAGAQLPTLTRWLLSVFDAGASPLVRLALGLALLLAWRSPPRVRARLVRAASIAWLPLVLLVGSGLALPLLCRLMGGP